MHMETTTIRTTETTSSRQAAVTGLAIVGFIVLIFIGMALAIYAARFVPEILTRAGTAAVNLFPGGDDKDADLVVVPPAETVPFENDGTVATSTPTTPPATPTPAPAAPRPVVVAPTPIITRVEVPASTNYHGLPDLVIENVQTGYLTNSNTSSFRASREVPDGERGAVRFTIANRGTNVSDRFEFEVKLPTSPSYTYKSRTQQTLRPGERVEYVLGFTQPREGRDREITIEVDQDRDIRESNESNNARTVEVDIEN